MARAVASAALLLSSALAARSALPRNARAPPPAPYDPKMAVEIEGPAPGLHAYPELLPYNPLATPGASVVASDKWARFTVLTPRLIRMEYARVVGYFEDRSTLAVPNRAVPLPPFTHAEAGGVLTITTSEVVLTYRVGTGGFSPASLSVAPVSKSSGGFPGWTFGQTEGGNLLGTIRGLDGQGNTPLNCTLNAAT